MKGDKECEEHQCEARPWCTWHPKDCMGKPWALEGIPKKDLPKISEEIDHI